MKKFFLISVALITFAFSGLFAHFYNRTDDLSLRYILWKNNLWSYPSDIIASAVIADKKRDSFVRGKTKEEVKKLFPTAYEESVNDYQKRYEKELKLKGKEYLWFSDWGVIIFFENGVGEDISIMKG